MFECYVCVCVFFLSLFSPVFRFILVRLVLLMPPTQPLCKYYFIRSLRIFICLYICLYVCSFGSIYILELENSIASFQCLKTENLENLYISSIRYLVIGIQHICTFQPISDANGNKSGGNIQFVWFSLSLLFL